MQEVEQDLIFSTVVSNNPDVNEFIVEFTRNGEMTDSFPIKTTNNFDELIEFFFEMEE
ncbi:hypothetical protein J1P26_12980 [Neobacillus sp. MM2021_6]|uniref:hypothetical protein n=1 Tax=Bacillaceae TaxID=186817 RepID=UPI001408C531|nr:MULTISPECIES: hypothetical protein [Bacillaceae]MBO0960612.1 hypothetical protein [Neobacillus sp. MM2021_6]NHC18602.1 hypothetical protein [Bacillus sp. MM2020_4]